MKGYFEAGEWEAGGFNVDLSVCFICCHFFRYVFFFKAFSLFFFSSVFWILTFLLCFSVLSQPLFFFFSSLSIYIYIHTLLFTYMAFFQPFCLTILLFSRFFFVIRVFFYIYIYIFRSFFHLIFITIFIFIFSFLTIASPPPRDRHKIFTGIKAKFITHALELRCRNSRNFLSQTKG